MLKKIISCFSKKTLDPEELRSDMLAAYSNVAKDPGGKHTFPTGRAFALSLGYPDKLLNSMPNEAISPFTGASNVAIFADIPEGSTILDLGCGAGLDSLIAAGKTGISGRVIGIDLSDSMLDRAAKAAELAGHNNIEFIRAPAEELPLNDTSVDVILINGLFNLNPYRSRIFPELHRVLNKGGSVYGAELILKTKGEPPVVADKTNWFS